MSCLPCFPPGKLNIQEQCQLNILLFLCALSKPHLISPLCALIFCALIVNSTLGLPSTVVHKGISTAASFGESVYLNFKLGTFCSRSEMRRNATSSRTVGTLVEKQCALHEVNDLVDRVGVSARSIGSEKRGSYCVKRESHLNVRSELATKKIELFGFSLVTYLLGGYSLGITFSTIIRHKKISHCDIYDS